MRLMAWSAMRVSAKHKYTSGSTSLSFTVQMKLQIASARTLSAGEAMGRALGNQRHQRAGSKADLRSNQRWPINRNAKTLCAGLVAIRRIRCGYRYVTVAALRFCDFRKLLPDRWGQPRTGAERHAARSPREPLPGSGQEYHCGADGKTRSVACLRDARGPATTDLVYGRALSRDLR